MTNLLSKPTNEDSCHYSSLRCRLSHDLYEQLASFPHKTRRILDGGITKSFKKNGGSSDLSCKNQVLVVLLNCLPLPCLDDANNRLITQEKNVDGDYGCFDVEMVVSAVCSVTLMDSNINSWKSMSPEKLRRRQKQFRKAHLFPLSLERQFASLYLLNNFFLGGSLQVSHILHN